MGSVALGTQGLTVSRLGFGCMGLTTAYGPKMPDDEILSLLDKVYENGVTLWDTANLYAFPQLSRLLTFRSPIVCQEEILAKAMDKIGRENLVVSTKTGIRIEMFPRLKIYADGSPAFIRQQCEDSLRRLGVDTLDLFYLHRIDQKTPIERTMMEMKKLVEEGKVKYVGLSECSAKTLRRAHRVHPISVIQMEYSLWSRGIEDEILPTCKELGVGLVAYSPLGRGFFGGTTDTAGLTSGDFRHTQERFKSDKNRAMLEKVQEIAMEKGVSMPQLALAWVTAQQDRAAGVVAIPGTTKEKNLLSNVASMDIELSKEDIEALEAAVPHQEVEGSRYGDDGSSVTRCEEENNVELTPEEAAELGLN